MKAALAVVASLLIAGVGWLAIAELFYGIGSLAIKAGLQGSPFLVAHIFLMWTVSPAVAGYFAVYVTRAIFQGVPLDTIYVGFVSAIGVIAALLLLYGIVLYSRDRMSGGQFLIVILQYTAVFVGARVGRYVARINQAL